MFHADLGRVFDLEDAAAERGGETAGRHRACHADFALAADFGARDRCVFLVQNPDRACGEQEIDDALLVRAGYEAVVVVHHGRDDACRAVRRCRYDTAAGGVFLVDRERVEIDPVEDRQRIAQGLFRTVTQFLHHGRGAALHLQAAGQHAGLAHAARDAIRHRLPYRQKSAANLRRAAPDLFVPEHDLGDGLARFLAQREQFVAAVERVGQGRRVSDDPVVGGFVVIDDEAAADRVVVARRDHLATRIECREAHAIRVVRQFLPLVEDEVGFLVERDLVFAEQTDFLVGADSLERRRNHIGIDLVGPLALETTEHRLVGAVAAARMCERAEQLRAHACHAREVALLLQPARDEARRGAHGPDGMRRRRADADLEQVEDADCHGTPKYPGGLDRSVCYPPAAPGSINSSRLPNGSST